MRTLKTSFFMMFAATMVLMGTCAVSASAAENTTIPPNAEFARAVNLKPLSALAVYTEGRVKSFDSFARGSMQFVTGAQRVNGQSASFTYLDLMLRPKLYADADVIYIKNKEI